jgi:hypothetical protein
VGDVNEAVAGLEERQDLLAQSARREALLRSASVLLAHRASLRAVRILHSEIRRALGEPEGALPFERYRSVREADEEHRRLSAELARRCSNGSGGLTWQHLRRRVTVWGSWAIVIGVFSLLTLRYAYALWDKARWARENPGGNWISRYYPKLNFLGSPVLRYDIAIDHDWGKAPPAESMARDNWSATWDTCVRVTADVALKLKLSADDKGALLVDDVPRIVVSRPGATQETVQLPPGVYHLQVQYQERRRGAKVRLEGIESQGTDYYSLQRPILEQEEIRCEGARRK